MLCASLSFQTVSALSIRLFVYLLLDWIVGFLVGFICAFDK
jgi:hypothetical protein